MVLWEEYRAGHPEGYSYSRFFDLFREFEARLSPVMRQEHRADDKVFVDYSGKKLGILRSGENPVFCWVYDAETIRNLIAPIPPVSWYVVAQEV